MPYIRVIEESDATGVLQKLYEASRTRSGQVSGIYKALSLRADRMKHMFDFSWTMLLGDGVGELTRTQREMIATAVSGINRCQYCTAVHGGALSGAAGDAALARSIAHDYTQVSLSAKDKAMLAFSEKLTVNPSGMAQEDVDALRAAGFSDAGVLDVVYIASWFNHMNRLMSALGVPPDPWSMAWQEETPPPAPAPLSGER